MRPRVQTGLLLVLTGSCCLTLVECAAPGVAGADGITIATIEPAAWLDASGLSADGFGRVRFETRSGKQLTAEVYRSSTFDSAKGPIWFVMHGASRNAQRYIRTAAPVAERFGALSIAIEFTKQDYPKGSDYTLSVETAAEVERVFQAVRRALGGDQPGYYLFGHSAGAQFTHRLLTFLPGAHVLGAVAANAGWYTLPVSDDPRFHAMPYGLRGSSVETKDLRGLFSTPLTILVGERDTTTADSDELVRGTPEAEKQGATRLARGTFYYGTAEARAKQLDTPFAWHLAIVPRASHDAAQMIASAGFFTFMPGESLCTPSTAADAAGLAITEILADPPDGNSGDANGDGRRDPSDDEFVEIVNAGSTPVCLSGWTLGDAEEAERHVFPLGRALPAGGTLIVFGGGVPKGRFGGAEVQWSSQGGLNLTNSGDVLTLRDARDVAVEQVSWGDCAGASCAKDHWPGELGIGGSIIRPAGGDWHAHAVMDGLPYSPGVNRTDGAGTQG